MSDKELIKLAKKIQEKSYSPYSNFPVGAALLGASGKVYLGTNIENASYGATICAERSAIIQAISAGEKDFQKIAITSKMKSPTYPCFLCRQVMSEFFDNNVEIIMGSNDDEYLKLTSEELIPYKFTKKELNNV